MKGPKQLHFHNNPEPSHFGALQTLKLAPPDVDKAKGYIARWRESKEPRQLMSTKYRTLKSTKNGVTNNHSQTLEIAYGKRPNSGQISARNTGSARIAAK